MTVQELRDLLDAFYAEQAAVKEGEEVEMRRVDYAQKLMKFAVLELMVR